MSRNAYWCSFYMYNKLNITVFSLLLFTSILRNIEEKGMRENDM